MFPGNIDESKIQHNISSESRATVTSASNVIIGISSIIITLLFELINTYGTSGYLPDHWYRSSGLCCLGSPCRQKIHQITPPFYIFGT